MSVCVCVCVCVCVSVSVCECVCVCVRRRRDEIECMGINHPATIKMNDPIHCVQWKPLGHPIATG